MKNSSISCSSGTPFIALFVSLVAVGVGLGEWALRSYIFDAGQDALMAKRVAAIYERRVWPVLGDSAVPNVLVGDSQMYTGILDHPDFFQLALSAETAPMLEILVREYFKFRPAKRVIIESGPQLFAQPQLDNGARRHDSYFTQNNWVQHALGVRLYVAEPGVGSFIGEVFNRLMASHRQQWISAAAAADVPMELPTTLPAHWGLYSAEQRRYFAVHRVISQRPVKEFETTSHFAAFREMIAFLAERGAQLCFLRLPLTSEYLDAILGDPAYNRAYRAFQDLAKAYAATYVDFLDLPMEYRPEYFMNQDHLSAEGSAVFAPLVFRACFGER
jgi:hypothetical protein